MSRTRNGADLFIEALEQYGVTKLFGNPGTTELPFMQSLNDSEIDYYLGLHEDVAVGMATGYAQRRRYHSHGDSSVNPLGVANMHLAPGLAHGLGNLYEAMWSGAPLLVTTGTHSTSFIHEEPILWGDMSRMAEPFCKWSAEVKHIDALPAMVRRAVRVALTPPTGPVFLEFPLDVQMAETDAAPERLGSIPDAGRGDPDAIADAANALADADEPVFILGDQIARSGPEAVDAAVALAEETGAAVYGEILMAETNFPMAHEQWVGFAPTSEAGVRDVMDTDTLAFIGCSTHTTPTFHKGPIFPENATEIHISNDAWQVGKNSPADVAVLGDPGRVMADLAETVKGHISDTERNRRLGHVEERIEALPAFTSTEEDEDRLSKMELGMAMHEAAPDAYIMNESVTSAAYLRGGWPFETEEYVSNKGGGLGYGLPATLGAAVAEDEVGSDRPVIGFVGDGSYLYYPQTLYTAARYDLDLVVVIPDNRNYWILKRNTAMLFEGDIDDFEYTGMDFDPAVDFVANARSHGAEGEVVEDPDDIDAALERALDYDGPFLLDVPIHD